ncbi:hypothetical protein SAMN04489835_4680 [Mycolicibacterium rutilum]|uniref:Uncharacterized protein n=1 Tax=Mycolicibacterium rutilum TaxID=370526 RepID=A0A1H6L4N8_MYCRU|nr:hypothetical protein [Mycolicibacterium rutilum]SEH83373.1 hypothetical protein SAMN04489835_4680 [Mycolicibacterium rutilum]
MTKTDLKSRNPNVPLPPGAHTLSTWADWDHHYRIVWTEDRSVDGHEATVRGAAIQMPDGHIDDGTLEEAPGVHFEFASAVDMTTEQAREFAALIVETADLLDGWAAR